MAEMDDFATDAPDLYPCCEHCDDSYHYDGLTDVHPEPCPDGCND